MQTKEILNEIAQAFCEPTNKNMIDLVKLRDFVSKDKNVSENQIFMKKLRDLEGKTSISRSEFEKHFTPNLKDVLVPHIQKVHFDYVFDSIDVDQSKQISKRELEQLNEDFKLNLSDEDMRLMINAASRDKQKVRKEDLYDLLSKE